jgi:hypothetical protein
VGPRVVLYAVVKRKIPSPRRESNPRTPIIQPIAQRYTDWAITVLNDYRQVLLNSSDNTVFVRLVAVSWVNDRFIKRAGYGRQTDSIIMNRLIGKDVAQFSVRPEEAGKTESSVRKVRSTSFNHWTGRLESWLNTSARGCITTFAVLIVTMGTLTWPAKGARSLKRDNSFMPNQLPLPRNFWRKLQIWSLKYQHQNYHNIHSNVNIVGFSEPCFQLTCSRRECRH